jgi:hypothetical protein
MRAPFLPALCLSVLLLGLAAGIYKVHFPPGPIADEAAYVLMTQSLWHDHDLTFESPDLLRAYRLWDQGPNGLILTTTDGGRTMHYGKPFVYSLAALPFYLVWKAQGFVVFNMALFLAMLWSAWWFLRREGAVGGLSSGFGPGLGHGLGPGLFLGGFFFASAAFVYVFWTQPEVFNMACVFFPLLIWQVVRRRAVFRDRDLALLAVAGALLAAAAASKENLAIFAAPIALDLLWPRRAPATADGAPAPAVRPVRNRVAAVAAFAAPALLAFLFMAAVEKRLTGSWSPYRGVQRRSFSSEFPIESRRDFWALYRGTSYGSWSGLGVQATPRTLLRSSWYFLAGRHTGLLPYFPFALFALALYLAGRKDRAQNLLFLALAGYCLSIVLLRPDNYQGGLGFLGNRYFASVYPALLFLPGPAAVLRRRKALLLPYAAAGLWTAAVVAVPLLQVAPEATLQSHVRAAPFQALPLELTLLRTLPGYFLQAWGNAVWAVPKENFFGDEHHPNGVWVRGASRSEVTVVTAAPIQAIHLRAYSISADNVLTLESPTDRVSVRFDSAEKREGTPVDLALSPVARDLGFFPGAAHEWFYRFILTTSDGIVPARRDPKSQDLRYLGTFLSFNEHGP